MPSTTSATGSSRPTSAVAVIDLPQPDSPSSARVSPRRAVKLTLVDGADGAGDGADVDGQAVDLEHGLGVGLADGRLVVYGSGHDGLSDALRGLGEAGQALLRDGEAPPLPGIGGDAGPGGEDGGRHRGDDDGQAGEERQPPRGVQVGAALRHHQAPADVGRLDADAEEAQRATRPA